MWSTPVRFVSKLTERELSPSFTHVRGLAHFAQQRCCVVLGKRPRGHFGISRRVPASIALTVAVNARTKTRRVWSPWSTATAWTLVWFFGCRSSPGHCNNFLEAAIMASRAHQAGGKMWTVESFSSETMSKPAETCFEWRGVAEQETCFEWRGVAEHGAALMWCGEQGPLPLDDLSDTPNCSHPW